MAKPSREVKKIAHASRHCPHPGHALQYDGDASKSHLLLPGSRARAGLSTMIPV